MGDKSDNMDEPDGMGNSMNNNEGGSDDSTIDIINKLSDTDRAYAESMLARDETEHGEEGPDPMAGQGEPQGKMFETFKFSKRQMTEAAKARKK